MSTERTLLRGATVITMEPNDQVRTADILIEDDKIAMIGPNLSIGDGSAAVIDLSDHIVVPGFIDTHRHLYQALLRGMASDWSLIQYCVAMFGTIGHHFTAEDMYLANRLGALDALDAGVTAVFDWSHNQLTPDHTDALIDGLDSTSLRATFGYGASMKEWAECLVPPFRSATPTPAHEVRRLRANRFASEDGLLTLGLAARGPDLSTMDVVKQDWQLARELDIRINLHIGQGIFPGRPAVVALQEAGLLGDDLTFGHCNLLTDEEMKMMADNGVTATVTPEDEMNMGHGWPPIGRLVQAGVWPNIGADTCIAVGGDQFTAMRFALAMPRAQDNGQVLDAGENPWNVKFGVYDALRMATIEGARALGQQDRIGSLAVGKQADLVAINTAHVSMTPLIDPVAAVVHHASRSVVDHVFVAGRHAKKDGKLVDADVQDCHRKANTASAEILNRAGVHAGWVPPQA
jgi:5-methylthioadenosine/S-adenosylhomocysteine deaminase